MNTRFRTRAPLVAMLGGLLAASAASAGMAYKVGEKLHGQAADMKESRQAGRRDPPPARTPRQATHREPAPRERSAPPERTARGNHQPDHSAPRPPASRETYTARNDNRQRGGHSQDRGDTPPAHPAPARPGRGGSADGKPDAPRGGGSAWNNRGDDGHGNERARWDANRHQRPGVAPRPGIAHRAAPRIVTSLPVGHRSYNWNGGAYYHYGSHWYRPYGTRYVTVGAPYGLFVSYLPGYYNSFWFGGVRYFHADSTYYLYEPVRRWYVVTQSPYGDDDNEESGSSSPDEDLYVYPAQGQSEQQQADDRYECHRWAVDETGYDPIDSDYDADRRADYLRAITACLTGRGYSVR